MGEPSLLIETSGRGGLVALAVGDAVVGERVLDPARRQNRDLAPFTSELLAAAGLTPKSLKGVMVSVGPGSYTGLRVGLISAKALAYAVGCELVAVPTFAAIAELAPAELGGVDVVSDGLQGLVYCQRYERRGGVMTATNALGILTLADWVATGPAAVSGPGVTLADAALDASVTRASPELRMPTAASLFAAGRGVAPVTREELFALEPLYLRPSSAEEQASRKAPGERPGERDRAWVGLVQTLLGEVEDREQVALLLLRLRGGQ